jgi:putative addiction module component (TIGR02574 family)
MTTTLQALGSDRMSEAERIELALAIWESLGDAAPAGPLSPDQRADLARRAAELDANPGIALTWEQIRASVERRP